MARNVLYGVDACSVGNRWMDKWVIVATADGQVGTCPTTATLMYTRFI
jgi:hypothetical protein